MRTTIFVRILLATLLPLVFIFILMTGVISNIIYVNSIASAKKTASLEAQHIARQFSDKLDLMTAHLTQMSLGMAEVRPDAPEAITQIEAKNKRLLEISPSFFSTWFAFEPGLFPGKGYVYQTLIRQNGSILPINDITPEVLQDPAHSPWYNIPLETGKLYLEMAESYDYGIGEGVRIAATMTAPIFVQNKVVGAIGVDIRYTDMFKVDLQPLGPDWQLMLISSAGQIVHATNEQHKGRNLFDYSFAALDEIKNAIKTKTPFWGEGIYPMSGENSLICLYPIVTADPQQVLFLCLGTPIKTLNTSACSAVWLIVSICILSLLLLTLSIFIASRNIVRPIKALSANFDKITHGEAHTVAEELLEAKEKQSNISELNILQTSLEKMLSQIKETHNLRVRATGERVEKEKILAISLAKGRLLAAMSREVRTPMSAILNISEMLLRGGKLTPQEQEQIQNIKLSSNTLLAILNDIHDASELESGKLTLEEKHFDFQNFIKNIRAMGEDLAEPNALDFRYEEMGDLPSVLYGDDTRLRQILFNILSNACKFTSQGSVTLRVFADNFSLRFAASDTGIGIRKEDMGFLFEPFRRFDLDKNQGIQGAGMGLPICKSLVELMDGTITVESEYNWGTTFTVVVPKIAGK